MCPLGSLFLCHGPCPFSERPERAGRGGLCAGSRAFPRRRCSQEAGHRCQGRHSAGLSSQLRPAPRGAAPSSSREKSGLLIVSPAASAKWGGYGCHCLPAGCGEGHQHCGDSSPHILSTLHPLYLLHRARRDLSKDKPDCVPTPAARTRLCRVQPLMSLRPHPSHLPPT